MKTTFKSVVVALALAASALASATPLNSIFTSSDNKVFSIDQARSITFASGTVTLVFVDGNSSYTYLADSDGSVANKIKASTSFTQFIKVGNTNEYLKPAFAKYIVCQNSQTTIGWNVGSSTMLSDGCAFQQAVKAVSN